MFVPRQYPPKLVVTIDLLQLEISRILIDACKFRCLNIQIFELDGFRDIAAKLAQLEGCKQNSVYRNNFRMRLNANALLWFV